jgi:alpha-tubulin suppressor-like RCC1 family protein
LQGLLKTVQANILFGWGANSFNQLGDNWSSTEEEAESIVLVPHQMLESFEKQISSVFCFSTYSAVLTSEGEVTNFLARCLLGEEVTVVVWGISLR